MEVRILGAPEIRHARHVVVPNRRLTRVLMGVLALRANVALSKHTLAEAMWGESPPASVDANLRSYVAELRRLLADSDPAGPRIEAVRSGYLLRVGANSLDVLGFESLAAEGRRYLAEGTVGLAADRLTRALGLWRGPVLAGLSIPAAVGLEAQRLEARRLDVVEDNVDARLALGQHADVADELPTLLDEHGLRERLWGQLMLALYRCGRVAEALETYQRLYRLLDTELGIAPSRANQDLHGRILALDAGLLLREVAPVRTVPWQLPPSPGPFVGRAAELAALDGVLRSSRGGPLAIAVLSGSPGVGKTALALRWAHQARDRFPDGCLYVDLDGYGPDEPRSVESVLVEFLHALGVSSTEPLAGRYRTELAGRRMLIVLDNAHSADHVRPLLPGDSCGVLVTSRDSLAGLVARDGARRVTVDLLPDTEAIDLLRALIGARIDAEPATTAALAHRCARLPLALRIAAELIVAESSTTMDQLVGELTEHGLDVLDAGGDKRTAVRSVLSWSIRHLSTGAARAFRLIGLHPGRHVDSHAVEALTASPARPLIGILVRANLLQEISPGRYCAHDLLRGYAYELAVHHEPEEERNAALTRLLDQQTHLAALATASLYPYEAHTRPTLATPGPQDIGFDGAAAAKAWLDAELDNLLAMARWAAKAGWLAYVTVLSSTLHRHLHTRGRHVDMLALHSLALAAALEHADRPAQAAALHDRGMALVRLGSYDRAFDDLNRALSLQVDVGDRAGECGSLRGLGMILSHQARLPGAMEYFERALDLSQALGDRVAEGSTLGNIGIIHEWLGEWPRALDTYQRALSIHRETAFRTAEADTLNNIAIVYRQSGRYTEAIDHLERALAAYRAVGDRGGEGAALNNLGLAHTKMGRGQTARDYLSQALTVHRDIDSRGAEVETLNILGLLDHRTGNHDAAIERFRDALARAVDIGAPGSEMNAHYGLGLALEATERSTDALSHYEAAARVAHDTGARSTEADALVGVSRCLPDRAEADRHRRQALTIYHALGVSESDRL